MPNRATRTRPRREDAPPEYVPVPIRVTARFEVTLQALRSATDARLFASEVSERLGHVFGEELQSAIAVLRTACVVGTIHDAQSEDVMRFTTVYERFCYIWPLDPPVEGVEAPMLRVGRSWFR